MSSMSRVRNGAPDKAMKFVNEHTKIDIDPCFQEECSICLDGYSQERCVQITGIPNCTHRIGYECLLKMLRDRPHEEKRCPLCRTVWIPGTAGAATRHNVRNLNNNPATVQLEVQRELYRMGMGAVEPPDADPSNLNRPRRDAIAISDDNDEDYESTLRSFNDFTRDIQSIRARASNTHRPIAQPRRRYSQLTRGRAAGAGADAGAGAGTRPSTRPTGRGYFSELLNETFVDPLRPSTRAASPDVVPLSPNATSIENMRARRLENREGRVEQRAERVEQRERALEQREKTVRDREAALAERERAVVIAEQRLGNVRALVLAQMAECETLAGRQREDLRRALG